MPRKIVKIIIDTNLWISFLISNKYIKLEKILSSDKVETLNCKQLINELVKVAQRPKFLKYFSDSDVQFLLSVLRKNTTEVTIGTEINVCRDPKDNFLLALAVDGEADLIITGDADLLTLENYKGTKIITIADFFDRYL